MYPNNNLIILFSLFTTILVYQPDIPLILLSLYQYNAITSDYDFEIAVPGANKIFTITDIEEASQINNSGTNKVGCIVATHPYYWRHEKGFDRNINFHQISDETIFSMAETNIVTSFTLVLH